MSEGKMKYSNLDKVKELGDQLATLLKAKALIVGGRESFVAVSEDIGYDMIDVSVDKESALAAVAKKEKDLRFAISELNVHFDTDGQP